MSSAEPFFLASKYLSMTAFTLLSASTLVQAFSSFFPHLPSRTTRSAIRRTAAAMTAISFQLRAGKFEVFFFLGAALPAGLEEGREAGLAPEVCVFLAFCAEAEGWP